MCFLSMSEFYFEFIHDCDAPAVIQLTLARLTIEVTAFLLLIVYPGIYLW